MLVGRDGWGNARWELSLANLSREQGFLLSRNLMRAALDGHLLLLQTGSKMTAVDLLAPGDSPSARVLWSRDMDEISSEVLGLAPHFEERLALQVAYNFELNTDFHLRRPEL